MTTKALSIDCQCPTCGAILEGEIPAIMAGMIATVGVKATCTVCGMEGVVRARKGRSEWNYSSADSVGIDQGCS